MFKKDYPVLSNFIGAWFPDADLDGLSDKEVVAEFLDTPNTDEHTQVRRELELLILEQELPIDEIAKEANRYFENEQDCRSWLEDLRNYFSDGMEQVRH